MRWQPAIRTVPPYFDNPAHIEALAHVARASPEDAGLDAGPHPRLLPRPAEGLLHGGRSLSLPLHEDGAASGASAWACRARSCRSSSSRASARRSGCSPMPSRRSRSLPGKGVKKLADDHAGLCLRLRGNAGRSGDRPGGDLREKRAARNSRSVPCLNDSEPSIAMMESHRPQRAAGLALSGLTCETPSAGPIYRRAAARGNVE